MIKTAVRQTPPIVTKRSIPGGTDGPVANPEPANTPADGVD